VKRCSRCKTDKSLDDFHTKQSYCKLCMKDYAKEWRKTYYRGPRRSEAQQSRLRQYGLTQEQYDELLVESCGRCAICTVAFTETPHIDHCHATGKVRGLLCRRCNRAIGLFKDDPSILLAGVEYLIR
jgi:hypothetical protein